VLSFYFTSGEITGTLWNFITGTVAVTFGVSVGLTIMASSYLFGVVPSVLSNPKDLSEHSFGS
jgi:hypothetical protein